MNVELAMQALEDAKAHPENFNMNTFFSGDGGPYSKPLVKDSEGFAPPCGTTACYAGFVALRAAPVGSIVKDGYIYHPDDQGGAGFVDRYAIKALDITADQAGALFYLNDIEEVEGAVRYLADNPDASSGTLWDLFYDESKHSAEPRHWDDL